MQFIFFYRLKDRYIFIQIKRINIVIGLSLQSVLMQISIHILGTREVNILSDKNKVEQIQNVIMGRSVFEKTYTFEELNLEIDVKLHYPSLRETAKINAYTSDVFMNTEQNPYTRLVYETLYTINEADEGTKAYQMIPKKKRVIDDEGNESVEEVVDKVELEDYFSPDKYARADILFMIGQDFNEWTSRFRG